MYRIASKVTPEQQYAIACQAFREMLAAGYTSVGEFHYLHHRPDGARGVEMAQALAQAASDTGIRLTLLPVYYNRGGFGQPAQPEQRRFVFSSADAFLEYVDACPQVSGIAPHSLRAVDIDEMPALVDGAQRLLGKDCVIHIHIAEQQREVDECRRATGSSPVALLMQHCQLNERWSLVHATHTSADERAAMLDAEVNVVLCPLTEANLGDGLFAATDYLRAGGRLAIGSDCNARIDAVEELRLLDYGQRLALQSRHCLSDRDGLGVRLWTEAAATGARALNLPAGTLQVGHHADLVVLEDQDLLAGMCPDRAMDALLCGGSRENLARVYVGGRVLETAITPQPAFLQAMQALLAES